MVLPLVFTIQLLLLTVKMVIKISEFVWKIVRIWNDVEWLLAILFLHFDYVCTKSILSGELIAARKMIDLLVIIQVIIDIGLIALAAP